MNVKFHKNIDCWTIALSLSLAFFLLFTLWGAKAFGDYRSCQFTIEGAAEIDRKYLVKESPEINARLTRLSIVENSYEELIVDVEFSGVREKVNMWAQCTGDAFEPSGGATLYPNRQKARLRVVPNYSEINFENEQRRVIPITQLKTDSIEIHLYRKIEVRGLFNDIKHELIWRVPCEKTWSLVSTYKNLRYDIDLEPIGKAKEIQEISDYKRRTDFGASGVKWPPKAVGRFRRSIPIRPGPRLKGADFHSELLDEIHNNGGLGPGQKSLPLSSFLSVEPGLGIDFEDVFGFSRDVYFDKNPGSGIFYVYPNRYFLDADTNRNPEIRFQYLAGKEPLEEGKVAVSMTLIPSLDQGEMSLAREVLGAYAMKHPDVIVREVLPLPLAEPPKISLVSMGRFLDIPDENIVVENTARVSGRIYYKFITSADKVPNIKLLLENGTLGGNIAFTPAGNNTQSKQPKITSEIRLRIAENRTAEGSALDRSMEWRNRSLFPVYPKYVHALFLHRHTGPLVYSWVTQKDNIAVQPGARVQFDNDHDFPSWLFRKEGASKVWLDFEYDTVCEPCLARIRRLIEDAAVRFNVASIEVETFTPLADLGAAKMTLYLRSRYHSPRAKDVRFIGKVALADKAKLQAGPLYLPEEVAVPYFEYAIRLYLADGTPYPSTEEGLRYIPHDSTEIVIGSKQVKESVGEIPDNP